MPDLVLLTVLSSDHVGRHRAASSDRNKRFVRHPAHQETLLSAKCRTGSVVISHLLSVLIS